MPYTEPMTVAAPSANHASKRDVKRRSVFELLPATLPLAHPAEASDGTAGQTTEKSSSDEHVNAMEQPHDFRIPNGVVSISPTYALRMPDGRVHEFDFHKYHGPTFLRKDGEPRARYPGERNPLWKAYQLWCDQGYRVDSEGNALWDAVIETT